MCIRDSCVSVDSLLDSPPDELDRHSRRLNASLHHIARSLGVNLPIYVLFTRLDRVASFAEYSRDLDSCAAGKILGMSIDSDGYWGPEVDTSDRARLLSCLFDESASSLVA